MRKPSRRKLALIGVFGVASVLAITACSLYHNHFFYGKLKHSINPRSIQYLNIDLLSKINSVAGTFDISRLIYRLGNPILSSEIVEIEMDSTAQRKLDQCLSFSPVKKKWVRIKVQLDGQVYKAKLKFHGTNNSHYRNNQYSYTIKLDKDSIYFKNFRRFKLISSFNADPSLSVINYLADSLGLISTYGEMRAVNINGERAGCFYMVEDIKKEYLERKHGITNFAVLANTADWTRKEKPLGLGPHVSDNDLFFGHLESDNNPLHPIAVDRFDKLTQILEKDDPDELVKLFDIDYMAKYLALAAIFNDLHFMTGDNLKLVYDFSRGMYFPVYRAEQSGCGFETPEFTLFPNFNKLIFKLKPEDYDKTTTKIFTVLLRNNKLRNKRDQILNEIVTRHGEFIAQIKRFHNKESKIMQHSSESRRDYQFKLEEQLGFVNSTLRVAKKYLNYGHVYGSCDTSSHTIHILADAYTPIRMYFRKDSSSISLANGIELDTKLNPKYVYQTLENKFGKLNPKKFVFINEITKDTIKNRHIHFNYIQKLNESVGSSEQSLEANGIRYRAIGDSLIIKKGTYSITSDLVISDYRLCFVEAGTTFKLHPKINLVVNGSLRVAGTKLNSVKVLNAGNQPFGTFAVIGKDSLSFCEIDYLRVSGGSSSSVEGLLFTGQFAIYNSNVELKNSSFSNSAGDDGLNIKFSKVNINSCQFVNNMADQVDLDFCFANVTNCTFLPSHIDSNGDGLDLSGSYAYVKSSSFNQFEDKGLSIGEKSKVLVFDCIFIGNATAIAVKDQTSAYLWENSFESNTSDIDTYIKKKIFNAPKVYSDVGSNDITVNVLDGDLRKLSEKFYTEESNRFYALYKDFRADGTLSNKSRLTDLIEQ